MQARTDISFRGHDASPLLRELVARRVAGLCQVSDRILTCTVVVEARASAGGKARPVRVHVVLALPGPDVSVTRESAGGPVERDVRLAVALAFDAVEAALRAVAAAGPRPQR